MKLTVNGEQHDHQGNETVLALIEELGAKKDHTALMINGAVIPAENWPETKLNECDEIEMLVFVGGG